MDLNFESLTNAHIITDDVLIFGSNLGPLDEHDHDRCLLPSIKSVHGSRLKTQCCQIYIQGETGSLL